MMKPKIKELKFKLKLYHSTFLISNNKYTLSLTTSHNRKTNETIGTLTELFNSKLKMFLFVISMQNYNPYIK